MKIVRLPGFVLIRLEDDNDGAVYGLADVTVSAQNVLVTEDLNIVEAINNLQLTLSGYQTQLARVLNTLTSIQQQLANQ